jgi:hypothetical protein
VVIVRRLAGDWIVNSLVQTDTERPAGRAVWAIGTELLRDIGRALVAYGAIVLVGAWVAGPTRLAVDLRKRLAPFFRDQPGTVFGVVVGLYSLVLLWGPTAASRQLVGILLLGVLLVFGVEMLRRQTLAEFPAVEGR